MRTDSSFTGLWLVGYEQHFHSSAGHSSRLFDFCDFLQFFADPGECVVAPLFVQHLSASEEDGELHLVTFFEEVTGVLELDLQVVVVCFRS